MNEKIIASHCNTYSNERYQLQSIINADKIYHFYNSYRESGERPEFLYVPTYDEVSDDLLRGMKYLGVIDKNTNLLVAMQEIFQLQLSEGGTTEHKRIDNGFMSFAFHPPLWDRDISKGYYAVSGVFVNQAYRKQGLATRLLKASIDIAEAHEAKGLYGDPNYLNHISQCVISKNFDIIGFTDGVTSGAENEQSLYITYYHSFSEHKPDIIKVNINVERYPLLKARNVLLQRFKDVGSLEKIELAYKDGRNIVYVLNSCIAKASFD